VEALAPSSYLRLINSVLCPLNAVSPECQYCVLGIQCPWNALMAYAAISIAVCVLDD
jgi:hypothetical protein